jgi:hypothetical protein
MIKSAQRWAQRAWVAAALSLCLVGAAARGAEDEPGDATVKTTPAQDKTEGMVPRRLVWPGVVVIIVIAVIVTAALTGPIIRANTDDEQDPSPPKSSD